MQKTACILALLMLSISLNVFSAKQKSFLSNPKDTILPLSDSSSKPIFKKWQVNAAVGTLYVGSLTGLGFLWYKNHDLEHFHTFNDLEEWKGVDKIGHAATAFQLSTIQSDVFEAAGYSKKQSAIISSLYTIGYMTGIEIMDGFSSGWGFSFSDICANKLGIGLFAINKAFDKNLVNLKYSFHQTKYAQYNKNLLGKNFIQQTLKDYNGQTYWLSFNISSYLPPESKFPKWLNLAVGYGAEGMIGARKNPAEINGNPIPSFKRYSQWYISPDIDFSQIPVRGRGWKLLMRSLNIFKCPAPTLEFNSENGFKMHYVYF